MGIEPTLSGWKADSWLWLGLSKLAKALFDMDFELSLFVVFGCGLLVDDGVRHQSVINFLRSFFIRINPLPHLTTAQIPLHGKGPYRESRLSSITHHSGISLQIQAQKLGFF